MENMSLEDLNRGFDEVTTEDLSLVEMDQLVTKFAMARNEYEIRKKELSTFFAEEVEATALRLQSALEKAGKKSYKVDGLGTISLVHKQTVTTPKTVEEKRQLFNYILDSYGQDVLDSMVSINHNTLNSFYNAEAERAEDKAMFHLPGLGSPVVRTETRFTKQRSK